MKYKAIVNEQFEFSDLSEEVVDLLPVSDKEFHILIKGKSYRATLLFVDWNSRLLEIRINGRNFQVQLEDKYDRLIHQLGLKSNNHKKIKEVKAPMPGLVLKTEVEAGQTIAPGDVLIILEAMKMENAIRAQASGKIKSVHVKQGEAVDKGQLLIEME